VKPKQYDIGIDTVERAKANLTTQEIIAVCKFQIDKYCWRKKGQDLEDVDKIIFYADLMKETIRIQDARKDTEEDK